MEHEFDPKKSATNFARHGIDFEEALALWRDARLRDVQARTPDEPRCLVVGRMAGATWSAVITRRDHRIRPTSGRRVIGFRLRGRHGDLPPDDERPVGVDPAIGDEEVPVRMPVGPGTVWGR